MAKTESAPSETTRTEVQIGLAVTDSRTGDHRRIIYADSQSVLLRDATGATTLLPRRAFDRELGTRYRPRPEATPNVDGGQYDRIRDRLAEYDAHEGRKAQHKADALREALDLLASATDGDVDADEADAASGPDNDWEVPYEEIPGIGSETANALRSQGIVTVSDVDGASDEMLRAVSGVGPSTVERIREFLT